MQNLLLEKIEQIAFEQPALPAVSEGDRSLTYGEINVWATSIAQVIANQHDQHRIVTILLPRSIELICAQLGVVKVGAAFLPIDPEQPENRILNIVKNSTTQLILTSRDVCLKAIPKQITLLYIEDISMQAGDSVAPHHALSVELAYLIYTSGSTGEPKGVMIGHNSFFDFSQWHAQYYHLSSTDKVPLLASPGFDASIAQIWPTLISGAHLLIPSESTRLSVPDLIEWLLSKKITSVLVPTPLGELLLEEDWPPHCCIKTFSLAGSRLHIYPRAGLPFKVYNYYGPTENTVVTTVGEVRPNSGESKALPSIGQRVRGSLVKILDDQQKAIAPGVVGQIAIGGAGLSLGYFNDPSTTKQSFVQHPLYGKIYLSGDLGYIDQDNFIHFVGRKDQQVKIRGNRVEMAEVLKAVKSHYLVKDAHIVVSKKNRDSELIAYIVWRNETKAVATNALKHYLQHRIPDYMVPSQYIVIESIPVTSNGKVDEKSLMLCNEALAYEITSVPPKTDFEKKLLGIWRDILGIKKMGVTDNFLALGGHSLAAIRIIARVKKVTGKESRFKDLMLHPTVRAYATCLEQSSENKDFLLNGQSSNELLPLSVQQEQVWFYQNLTEGKTPYHAQLSVRFLGKINPESLKIALDRIVNRHEILRTIYLEQDGIPKQKILPHAKAYFNYVDLSSQASADSKLEALRDVQITQPFDLSKLPMARWTLFKLSASEYELLLVEHHIIHDGWSFSILMTELEAHYNAVLNHSEPNLAALPLQYKDYCVWQKKQISNGHFNEAKRFWQQQLDGMNECLPLPLDYPRPKQQTFYGRLLRVDLPAELPDRLTALSHKLGITLFSLMFASFKLLLYRYTHCKDICIGSAFANRTHEETEHLIGMFVNSVAIRTALDPTDPVETFLQKVNSNIFDASNYQEYPFPTLVQNLAVTRDASYNPLFQTMFSFHNSNVISPILGDAYGTVRELGNGSAKLDLNIIVVPYSFRKRKKDSLIDNRIKLLWEYNQGLFKEESIRRMIKNYLTLLNNLEDNLHQAIQSIPFISKSELQQIYCFSNFTKGKENIPKQTFLQKILQYKDSAKIAVQDGDRSISFSSLIAQSVDLANELSHERYGDIIGIAYPRSIELIVAELAVLLSKKSFLPVDPESPITRNISILLDAGVQTLLSSSAFDDRFIQISVDGRKHPTQHRSKIGITDTERLAYVMYTSGTTGKPKGVKIGLTSFSAYIDAFTAQFEMDKATKATLSHSPAFDASIREIFPALSSEATIYIPPKALLLDPESLKRWIITHALTHVTLPTIIVEKLLLLRWPEECALKYIITGGARLHTRPCVEQPFKLYNDYGPTEATISVTSGLVESKGNSLPDVGLTRAHCEVWILDQDQQIQPIGVPGEIYIGGLCLSQGYLNNDDLNEEKFTKHIFLEEKKLYKTGDMGQWTSTGRLEFLGRRDEQVQVNGFRVEPAEIKNIILEIDAITDAFVTIDPTQVITAYYVANNNLSLERDIRQHCLHRMPRYMLPYYFVRLEQLPITQNGKVDRKKLLKPKKVAKGNSVSVASSTVSWVQNLWRELLNIRDIEQDDHFFDLGGHSMRLVEMQARIEKEKKINIPIVKFFEYTTPTQIAYLIDHGIADTPNQNIEAGFDRRKKVIARQKTLLEEGATYE